MRHFPARLIGTALIGAFCFVSAQEATPSLDEVAQRSVVGAVAGRLRENYVFPDVGDEAAQAIETALANGDYIGLKQPQEFADRLTSDLRAVAADKHLLVTVAGRPPAPPVGAPRPRSPRGVSRADILVGNVGYVEIDSFPPPYAFRESVDAAMAALKETRALILDLRRNGGGSPESVSYLVSYFLASDERIHINTFFSRIPGTRTYRSQEFWSESVPFSYTGKPVHVLTGEDTFSGGEEFAYDMQAMKLAQLIGATTRGGANPGGNFPLPGGLVIFVPGGRAENPITGQNWEGVGVVPDVDSPSEAALSVALQQLGLAPTGAEVADVSLSRVYEPTAPRTTPQAESEAAIRRVSKEAALGRPNFDLLSPQLAEAFRPQILNMQERFTSLGSIETVTFVRVLPFGADVYDVEYENGSMRWTIAVAGDKVEMASIQPVPR